MKKIINSIAIVLTAIIFNTGCDKTPIIPQRDHGHNPPPELTLCDSLPQAIGFAYVQQVHEFSLHEFLMQIYYTWPAPVLSDNNHAEFSLIINNVDYYDKEITDYGDSSNPGVATLSTAIPDTTFKNNTCTAYIVGHYTNDPSCAAAYIASITISTTNAKRPK